MSSVSRIIVKKLNVSPSKEKYVVRTSSERSQKGFARLTLSESQVALPVRADDVENEPQSRRDEVRFSNAAPNATVA